MSHIFISYSKKNSDYAYALADFLQEQGFNIWIDRSGIEYGVSWWDAIVEGLDGCGALIVVMTPESHKSEWVQKEVFIALQDKKPVFPLLLNGNNWKLFVLTQYKDVRDRSLPDGDFLERISQYVTPKGKGVNKPNVIQVQPMPTSATPSFDIDAAITRFGAAFRAKNWSEALNVLGRIRASGEDPTPFDPDEFERRVQAAIEVEENTRKRQAYGAERSRQYKRVAAMTDYSDAETVWAALQKVWLNFPDYDPDNLARFKPAPKRPHSLDVLPAPFAWIEIPNRDYCIAKYPLTNSQYKLFVDADGYEEREYWTELGWEMKAKGRNWDKRTNNRWLDTGEAWTQPQFWDDPKWNGAEQPVVGVSWYEAVAFCRWLSAAAGEIIMLPTEEQWQYAAQGGDERDYPWGKEWDADRCNNNVDGGANRITTLVHQYEGIGDSPFGVVDMAGNVWEWCLTNYISGENDIDGQATDRVIRGGAWRYDNREYFLCGRRDGNNPWARNKTTGFRLVLLR